MIYALQTFCAFLYRRDTKSWRLHRNACRAMLPKAERSEVEKNGE